MTRFDERHDEDGGRVLAVTGDVEMSVVDEFVEQARRRLSEDEQLRVDLGDVSFIDSSGLGALVLLRNEAVAQAKSLSLLNVPPAIGRLLQLTGLRDAFDIRLGNT